MKSPFILRTIVLTLVIFFAAITLSFAKQFETFDGQFYNGLYYPRIDIIEWGTPPHLEFHIYQKDKPIDLAAVAGDKNGKPVLWLNYHLDYRGENICRHVIAPAQFKDGDKLYTYKETSQPDFDIIYVSTIPFAPDRKLTDYTLKPYSTCSDEMASNKPDVAPNRSPASEPKKDEAKPGKNIGVDYDNAAVPFSF